MPMYLIAIRLSINRLIKLLLLITRPKRMKSNRQLVVKNIYPVARYDQGIQMEPIIASLARTQLCKVDSLSRRRKKIYGALLEINNSHFKKMDGVNVKNVYTQIVLRFPKLIYLK